MRTLRTKIMPWTRLVALPCKISRGIVSDERAFEIELSGKRCHVSVAPAHYFWNEKNVPLGKDEPSGDQEINGKIAARLLEHQNGTALVSIPDGNVVSVEVGAISERPTEIVIDVSV
jgi:hypothetical protein